MYCKNCGAEMNENQAICLNCGLNKGAGMRYCANCGRELAPNAAACLNCGFSADYGVSPKPVEDTWNKKIGNYDKITLAIICFFLGGLGIHNFLLGETKKGIVKIVASCCFGIGAILAIIDFVKILIDKYEVDPEKLI